MKFWWKIKIGWFYLQSGMRRMYELGQWIRNNYGWLNGGKFRHNNTYAESSPVDRCIESTQVLLSGLYPVNSEDAFVENLLWRPIPVHSTPSKLNKVQITSFKINLQKFDNIFRLKLILYNCFLGNYWNAHVSEIEGIVS